MTEVFQNKLKIIRQYETLVIIYQTKILSNEYHQDDNRVTVPRIQLFANLN